MAALLAACAAPTTQPMNPLYMPHLNALSVVTIAGNGRKASKDGNGTAASFNAPTDITIDNSGNLFILEGGTPAIRIVDRNAKVTTLTRSLKAPSAMAFSSVTQILYVASSNTGVVDTVSKVGDVSRFVRIPDFHELPPDLISKMVFDESGVMHVTESRNGAYVRVAKSKKISHEFLAPGVFGICYGGDAVYLVDQLEGELVKMNGWNPKIQVKSDLLKFTADATFDSDNGAFYVTDPQNNRILQILDRQVTVFAGDGKPQERDGSLARAAFNYPVGIAYVSKLRALFVADSAGNTLRMIQMP